MHHTVYFVHNKLDDEGCLAMGRVGGWGGGLLKPNDLFPSPPPAYTHDIHVLTNGHIHVAPMETYLQMVAINELRTAEDRSFPRGAAMATVMGSQTTHLWGRRGRSVRMGRSRRRGE